MDAEVRGNYVRVINVELNQSYLKDISAVKNACSWKITGQNYYIEFLHGVYVYEWFRGLMELV